RAGLTLLVGRSAGHLDGTRRTLRRAPFLDVHARERGFADWKTNADSFRSTPTAAIFGASSMTTTLLIYGVLPTLF
ncbi:MAG: hypothetical protein ACK58T_26335, partial [Phycisphaerae bacterium]